MLSNFLADKEDMEEVWRQSWVTLDIEVRVQQNSPLGLTLKEVSLNTSISVYCGFLYEAK